MAIDELYGETEPMTSRTTGMRRSGRTRTSRSLSTDPRLRRAAIEQNPAQGFDGPPDEAMAAAVEILAEEIDNELAGEESGTT